MRLASPARTRVVMADCLRGAVGGLVAGGAFLVVNMWFATSMSEPAKIGLGAGWNDEEADAYGIDLGANLTDRFDSFDEGLEVIIGLLSNETTTFKGRFWKVVDARCEPKPVQRPHPPICIGGTGERRTLRSVARFAQHWNFPGGGPDVLTSKRDVLHRHCDAIGRDPGEIMISTHVRLSEDGDIGTLTGKVEELGKAGLDLAIVYLPPPHTPAVLDDVVKALEPLR